MNNDYIKIINKVLDDEGGYNKIKGDKGGETYCGISRVSNPNWDGWRIVDAHKLKYNEKLAELNGSVTKFYYENYYLMNGIHLLNDFSIKYIIFDWVVNSKASTAIKKIQYIVSAKPDGNLGPKTAALINGYKPEHLFNIIKHTRIDYYNTIALIDDNEKFLTGWLNRINNINYENS